MMDRLSVFVIFSIIFGAASDVPLNHPVREVHFKRLPNGSKEYEFQYDLDNGGTYRGQTHVRDTNADWDVDIYFLFGAENEIYWTKIDRNEHKEGENFTQTVRKVQRSDGHLDYEDDHVKYHMTFDGQISVSAYLTKWNLSNICFTKGDHETFNFTISATNNLRKYKGTTYHESDDPRVQLLSLKDAMKETVYKIHFTDTELHSGEEFCRGYDELYEGWSVWGINIESWANHKLLVMLVG